MSFRHFLLNIKTIAGVLLCLERHTPRYLREGFKQETGNTVRTEKSSKGSTNAFIEAMVKKGYGGKSD
jgi:hypothetical protein